MKACDRSSRARTAITAIRLFRKRLFPPPKSAVPPRRPAKRPVAPQRPPTPNPATSPANEILEGSVARAEPLKPEAPVTEEAVIQTPPPHGVAACHARGDARRY